MQTWVCIKWYVFTMHDN